MKKLILVAIIVIICIAGCTLSGLDVKLDKASTEASTEVAPEN